jgi:RND family efflux transporter MFP subunit
MELATPAPRRGKKKVWIFSGIGVLLAVLVAGILVARNAQSDGDGKKKKNGQETPAAPVELSVLSRGSISTFLQTTATLEARNSATLVAQKAGPIAAILVEEGDWVSAGQVLARLDDTEAEVALERAQVNLEVARREHDRGLKLLEGSLISEKEMDDFRLKLRTADVELEQKKFEFSQTRLAAPFAGRVADRFVKLGETVTVGKECFRVVDFNPLRARLYFPERELARVRAGQEAVLRVDSHPGRAFRARVELVNPVVDQTNGTFRVLLEIPNAKGELRPGSFARVQLKTGDFADALLMPKRGIVQEDGEDFVFKARGDSVVRVGVSVGAVEGETAQILEGLAAGDSVVTIGQGGLKPGSKIKPVGF